MGYRSVVGFNIVGDLESILDIFHSLYNKSYYVNGVATKKRIVVSPENIQVPAHEYYAGDLVTSFELCSHIYQGQTNHKPNAKELKEFYSLNFYHDWIKWSEDIDDYRYSVLQEYSQENKKLISSSFFRQGEDPEDYDEKHLVFKDGESIPLNSKKNPHKHASMYFNLFDVSKAESVDEVDDSEMDEPSDDDNSQAIPMHIYYNQEDTLSFYVEEAEKQSYKLNSEFLAIEDAYLSTLPVEKKFLKAIQYSRIDVLEELLKTNIDTLSTDKNIEKINETLKNCYEEQFSKSISKDLYLDILKILMTNKIPVQLSWNTLTKSIIVPEEKIKSIQIEKELLSENLIENNQKRTLKL